MIGRWRVKFRRAGLRFRLFLAILGPGIITANVDNDAGGSRPIPRPERDSASLLSGSSFPSAWP
jgi:hypothetical protein